MPLPPGFQLIDEWPSKRRLPPGFTLIGEEEETEEERRKRLMLEGAEEPSTLEKVGQALSGGLDRGFAKAWDFVSGATALPTRMGLTEPSGEAPGLDYAKKRAEELRAQAEPLPEGTGYEILSGLAEAPGQAAKYAPLAALTAATLGAGAIPTGLGLAATDIADIYGRGGTAPEALAQGAISGASGAVMGLAGKMGLPGRAATGAGTMGAVTALTGGEPEDIAAGALTGGILGAISKAKPKEPELAPIPTASGLASLEEHIKLGTATKAEEDLWQKFITSMVDTAATVDEVTGVYRTAKGLKRSSFKGSVPEELDPGQDAYEVLRGTQKRVGQITLSNIENQQRDFNGNVVGPSLVSHLRKVDPKELDDFKRFMVVRHEADLVTRKGIAPNVDPDEAMLLIEYGKSKGWDKVHDDIVTWANNDKKRLVDAGYLAPEEYQRFVDENPFYAPLKREFEREDVGGGTGTGMVDLRSPIKSRVMPDDLEGPGDAVLTSKKAVKDPIANLMLDSAKVTSIANRTAVGRLLAKYADELPDAMAGHIERVEPPKGLNPMQLSAWEAKSAKDNIIRIVDQGEDKYYHINPRLYETLKGMDKLSSEFFINSRLGRTITAAKRGVMLGATGVNAGFQLVTNPLRDMFTAMLQKPTGALGVPYKAMRSFLGATGRSKEWQKYLEDYRAGGGFTSQALGATYEDQLMLQKRLLEDSAFADTIKHPVEAVKRVLSAFEAINRAPEYVRAKQAYGGSGFEAEIAGQRAAADVTTDFAKMGSVAQGIGQMVPFFTANISGLDTMLKTVVRRPVRTGAIAATAITTPKLLSWYLGKDEQWYQELPQWEKNLFVHFNLGGEILRVPMPYGWGQVFGAVPEEVVNGIYKNDPEGAGKAIVEALGQALPINPALSGENKLARTFGGMVPALVKPAAEVVSNMDFFRGTPIESRAMEQLVPEERYNERTPEIYKALGKAIGQSPLQIQHLFEGYSGGLARDITNIPQSGEGLRALAALPGKIGSRAESLQAGETEAPGEPGLHKIPAFGRLFSNPERTGRSVNEFYDQLKEDEQAYKTLQKFIREGDFAKVASFMEENAEKISRLKMERRLAEVLKTLKNAKDVQAATELARYALGR